jgi:RNA polymerase sigma-70 factor, ECF subfamily
MANPDRLISDYLEGDDAAIRLVDGWVDAVLRDGFQSLRDEWDDMRQEVRARVVISLRRSRFEGRSTLRTFVHRVARNACIDYVRRIGRHRGALPMPDELPVDEEESPASRAWAARQMLARLMEGMTDEDRRMIELVFSEYRSYAEVAALLGIPEGTVKSRMSRLRDRLLDRRRALREGDRP